MRILVISDISWHRIEKFQELTRWIEEIHPDLVLFAGDLVNDMFGPDNKYWGSVYALFKFLNKNKIQTFFIRGNWDDCSYYDKIIKLTEKHLPYVKEISEKTENFHGLKILGLSHSFTNNLKEIKYLAEGFQEPYDLILAHAEYKRRIWLFHLNAKLVITGHFDKQLCQIQNKVFISLESFPDQNAVIDYESTSYKIQYFDNRMSEVVLRRASFSNGRLTWEENPFEYKRLYASQAEDLMSAKTQLGIDRTKRYEIINRLLKHGIGKKQIEEYLQISLPRPSTSG